MEIEMNKKMEEERKKCGREKASRG